MKISLTRSGVAWSLLFLTTAAKAAGAALTLDESLAIAVHRAPQLAARQAGIDAAREGSASAGRLPDPELVAGIDNLPTSGPDAYALGNDFMTMRKVGVMQSVPSGAKRAAQRARAQASVSVAEMETEQARRETAQSTADAWVAVHAAEVALQGLLELKPDLDLQLAAMRARVAGNGATVFDAVTAQAASADLDDRLLQARRDVDAARAELRRWLGDDADRELAPPPPFDHLPADREQLLATLHHHAELKAMDSRIAAARSDVALANADRHPDWSAEVDYARRGAAFSDMVSLQFRVALPLWPHYRQDPAIRERQAMVRQLEADRDATLQMHASEVTQMLESWEAARARLELFERVRLPLARQRSQLALAGLQSGRMDLRTTLASYADEIELRRNHAELLGNLGRYWAYLTYLTAAGESP